MIEKEHRHITDKSTDANIPRFFNTQDYKIIRPIGKGSFGVTYLVEDSKTIGRSVLKSIDLTRVSKKDVFDVFEEAEILKHLNHINVVKFKEVFKSSFPNLSLNIVMEYADGGDLAIELKSYTDREQYMPERIVLRWFLQICLALRHVHERKIIHRDLKSSNIFLTAEGLVKLGDFGISKRLDFTLDHANTIIGTPYYLSPEMIINEPYSYKSDVWSLGVLLYEMCAQKMPFDASSLPLLTVKIIKGEFEDIPNCYSWQIKSLVKDMLSVDVDDRPTVNEILGNDSILICLDMPIMQDTIRLVLQEIKAGKLNSKDFEVNQLTLECIA